MQAPNNLDADFGDLEKASDGSYFPPLVCSTTTSLIVRLAGRRPVARHLAFPARAADVRALLSRDLAGRLAVLEKGTCLVRLDFVVCPWCLSLLLN
jgi:hypothetical protein